MQMHARMGIVGNNEVYLYVSKSYPYKEALKSRGYKFCPEDKEWYTSKQVASNEEAVEWIHNELQYLFQLAVANWTPTEGTVGFVAIEKRIAKLKDYFGWQFSAPDAPGYVKTEKPSTEYLAEAEYIKA